MVEDGNNPVLLSFLFLEYFVKSDGGEIVLSIR